MAASIKSIKSINDRKQKWLDFLDPSGNERTVYLINTEVGEPGPRPLPQPQLMEERINWAYESYLAQLNRAEWLADDRIPMVSPYTGTEIFAEAFGCKVQYPSNDMPFALPKYMSLKDAYSMRVPEVCDTPLYNLFEAARRLRQKAGGGAALQLPDIQSPLDIAALILYKEEFYAAMAEEPEAIKELAAKAQALLTAFLDAWFKEFGNAYIAHFPTYYMEGGMTLSEDEIGAFGTQMFNEFCLNPINTLSERYGGIGIHCCADSEHQWPNFKQIRGLKLLNITKNERYARESIKFFGNSVAYWPLSGAQESQMDPPWLSDCPDDVHVVVTYRADTKREAAETAKYAAELCERRKSH